MKCLEMSAALSDEISAFDSTFGGKGINSGGLMKCLEMSAALSDEISALDFSVHWFY